MEIQSKNHTLPTNLVENFQLKEEVEKADNNQSSKGKVDDCVGAINDHAVGDAEGVVQVCNEETNKNIWRYTIEIPG